MCLSPSEDAGEGLGARRSSAAQEKRLPLLASSCPNFCDYLTLLPPKPSSSSMGRTWGVWREGRDAGVRQDLLRLRGPGRWADLAG